MARRGKCRCGCLLKFHKGPRGYKTRCPACGAVVRLRVRSKKKKRPKTREVACACGIVLTVVDDGPRVCPNCQRTVGGPPRKPLSPLQEALQNASSPTEEVSPYEAHELAEPLPEAEPVTDEVVSAAASALPSQILPAANLESDRDAGTNTCVTCGVPIPEHRKHCPMCQTRKVLIASLEGDPFEVAPVPSEEYEVPRRKRKKIPYALIALGVAFAILCVAAWLWFRVE